jgi:hypothetical protein
VDVQQSFTCWEFFRRESVSMAVSLPDSFAKRFFTGKIIDCQRLEHVRPPLILPLILYNWDSALCLAGQ